MTQRMHQNRGFSIPRLFLSMLMGAAVCTAVPVRAEDDLERRASWAVPDAQQVRSAVDAWLGTLGAAEQVKRDADAIWVAAGAPSAGRDVLERIASTAALVDEDARKLWNLVHSESLPAQDTPAALNPSALKFAVLESASLPPVVRNNLRLLYGRWLVQNNFFDEANEQLKELPVGEVADPASLLFYRSVCNHQLLQKNECLSDLRMLMQNEALVPRRFLTVAKLMQADMTGLKPDTLDEVSRMMEDIRRRLEFGRAGKRVRTEEEEVIAKLDKMIEELEKQQQQQQQQASSGGSSSPSSPRQESTPGGVQGPGEVDPKSLGSKSGWGNLPPKERQEALQNISKDLPTHFRDAIEEYFRKLAHEGMKK